MSTTPLAPVKDLDHLVLTCADVDATMAWYAKYLGMTPEHFTSAGAGGEQRAALKFGTHKINLHQRGHEFEPKARTALPGTADVCFLLDDGVRLDHVVRDFAREGVDVLEGGGVVLRTGARGRLRSVYVRDPDGNLVELSQYVD